MTFHDHKELAAFCRSLRLQVGLTQQQLGQAIGQQVAAVSHAENPRHGTERDGLRAKILAHFGYTLARPYVVEDTRATPAQKTD